MEKYLPVDADPIIKTNNDIAFPLSVIGGNCEDYNNWLVSNFLQIKYNIFHKYYKLNMLTFDVRYFMFWKCLKTRVKIILFGKNIIPEIIKAINKEYYIGVVLNELYNPQSDFYNQRNFMHDKFIYGYNDCNKVLYLLSVGKKGIYQKHEISYNDFIKAYNAYFFNHFIVSIKFNAKFPIELKNQKKINKKLCQYINNKANHGIGCYEVILNDLEKSNELNMRILRPFKEHKTILAKLDKSFSVIAHNFEIIFTLAIKYNLTKKVDLLSNIKRLLMETREIEIELIYNYLQSQKMVGEKDDVI